MSSITPLSTWGSASNLEKFVEGLPVNKEGGQQLVDAVKGKAEGLSDPQKLEYYTAVLKVLKPISTKHNASRSALRERVADLVKNSFKNGVNGYEESRELRNQLRQLEDFSAELDHLSAAPMVLRRRIAESKTGESNDIIKDLFHEVTALRNDVDTIKGEMTEVKQTVQLMNDQMGQLLQQMNRLAGKLLND